MIAHFPFVSRKRYLKRVAERDAALAASTGHPAQLEQELQVMRTALLSLPGSFADRVPLEWLKPLATPLRGDACLFVTHAAAQHIKLHVLDHVHRLAASGVSVVLIINTDLDPASLPLPTDMLTDLQGCAVRRNAGYDFGAWAHAYALLDTGGCERLYLVNDSIVGPLDDAAFASMMARIRALDADLVGLTQNPYPRWHLQSFFLVANRRLLASAAFSGLLRHIVNLPSKEAVINTYETRISGHLQSQGFRCEALFPQLEPGSPLPDDSYFRWSRLVESGFPFIKASILKQVRDDADARRLVPARYREAAGTP